MGSCEPVSGDASQASTADGRREVAAWESNGSHCS